MSSYKDSFRRFLDASPGRLHVAAHSHHLWPDVSLDAQVRAWNDAARLADRKWDYILGELAPALRGRIAAILGLPDPDTLVFAPNTHDLVVRLRSCIPGRARILTSDAEFHSFTRQSMRWEEEGSVAIERVAAEPFESFPDRFLAALEAGEYELVYLSHVFYSSGYAVPAETLAAIAEAAGDKAFVVVDAYHGFLAVPTDLGAIADRVFYVAGGYKYAMSGEGVCFMHCPPGWGARPVDTGWFAGYTSLEDGVVSVAYEESGQRFAGATFDPSGLYRMHAVLGWLDDLGVTVADIHAHVVALQRRFLDGLPAIEHPDIRAETLLPAASIAGRGHFLTFQTDRAAAIAASLLTRDIVCDHRADRLRFGFGLYHDPADIDALLDAL